MYSMISFTAMKPYRFNKFLLGIVTGLLVLLALQGYWLFHSVQWKKREFNAVINLKLEQACSDRIKKQADSISNALFGWLMDTTLTSIYSKPGTTPELIGSMIYYIKDKKWPREAMSFSSKSEERPITSDTSEVKRIVALKVCEQLRGTYQKNQAIYYYTKTTGDSAVNLAERLKLDTTDIKFIYSNLLAKQKITSPYLLFFMGQTDSVRVDSIQRLSAKDNALVSRPYESGMFNEQYKPVLVYASFSNPVKWLVGQLWMPLLLSLGIIILITGLLIYFYRVIRKQKQLSILKNDFIDNMTHELKTPIATISAAAEAMQQFGARADEQKAEKYLNAIRTQSAQLGSIVNKVLDISSFEKEEVSIRKINTSLTNILKEIQENQWMLQSQKAAHIEIPDRELSILGDPFHLKNVFYNLVDNALKYNDKETALVEISTEENERSLTVRVRDNGRGIEKDAIPHLFEKFYRVPQGNVHAIKGFGLGLFYVKSIIDMHGASIEVQSKPGVETIFSIYFPKAIMS